MDKRKYRIGLDLGSTSIGWSLVEINDKSEAIDIIDMGVRIFSDGREAKSKAPLSVKRRESRGIRRNHDRFLERRTNLIKVFTEKGFLAENYNDNKDVFVKNPYYLRVRALDEKVELNEFARLILHLAQRRGFKSNRKDKTKESGSMKKAINETIEILNSQNFRTIGELLYQKNQAEQIHKKPSIRFRYDKNSEMQNLIFPSRGLMEDEFNKIWDKQSEFYDVLDSNLKEQLHHIIFYQRPLKPQIVGKCYLETDEHCAPKASFAFQEARIWQTLNNFKIREILTGDILELSQDDRDKLYKHLYSRENENFSKLREILFGKEQADNYRLNYEKHISDKIYGHQSNYEFNKKAKLKKSWNCLDEKDKCDIIYLLLSDKTEDDLKSELQKYDFNNEQIDIILNADLPKGYGDLSEKALCKILPYLRAGQNYSDACLSAGYNHSSRYYGEIYNEGNLPYYGELLPHRVIPSNIKTGDELADKFGKINNPTVHIALNQTRKLINAICLRYGAPGEIVIELARELKMSKEKQNEYESKQRKRLLDNERINQILKDEGVECNSDNRLKYRLWEELNKDPFARKCVFSGKVINMDFLFSNEIEIEHILPYSRTFDDSYNNKTLAFRSANNYKGNQSPYEAFGQSNEISNWQDILIRAEHLPYPKRKRFDKDAMKEFNDENAIIARMLTDTQYMTKVVREYLMYVCGDDKIWTVKGGLVAKLRHSWGLNTLLNTDNEKNRADHRHHIVDALIIACTTRSTVKKYAKTKTEIVKKDTISPYKNYNRETLQARILKTIVSHKPEQADINRLKTNNQTAGQLLEDTAYMFKDVVDKKYANYTVRKDISSFSNEDQIKNIVDPLIRDNFLNHLETESNFKQWRDDWCKKHNIYKLKTIEKKDMKTMTGIKDKNNREFKYYHFAENLFADIYITHPWKDNQKWNLEIIPSFNAHQKGFIPEWKKEYPHAKRIMRVYKNDMIALDIDNETKIYRVKLITKGMVFLSEHSTAVETKEISFSGIKLQRHKARKIGVDILGRVFDPGK